MPHSKSTAKKILGTKPRKLTTRPKKVFVGAEDVSLDPMELLVRTTLGAIHGAHTGAQKIQKLIEYKNHFLKQFRNILSPDTSGVTHHEYSLNSPWPQPSPIDMEALPSTVLHVPQFEINDFLKKVVSRYIRTIKWYWPIALQKTMQSPDLVPVEDAEMGRMVEETSFCYLLLPLTETPELEGHFPKDLVEKTPGVTYFTVDNASIDLMTALPKMHVASTVTLFQKNGTGPLIPTAITVQGKLWRSGSEGWELAKYFALQGMAYNAIFCTHPRNHFTMDGINAITKTVFSEKHLLRQLLAPHLYMQLPLNFAVLYIDKSVAHNDQKEIYTPFASNKESIFELLKASYQGIDGHSAYPSYVFKYGPPRVHSAYGEFLESYYQVISRFVGSVVEHIPKDDFGVKKWAKEISKMLPGFPNEKKIFQGTHLRDALSTFILTVSVIHSADHYTYSSLSVNQVPLRLRVPAPGPSVELADPKTKKVDRMDLFRHHMAKKMYFDTTPVTRLMDTKYGFTQRELKEAQKKFIQELKLTDANLKTKRFTPLKEIATGIQF